MSMHNIYGGDFEDPLNVLNMHTVDTLDLCNHSVLELLENANLIEYFSSIDNGPETLDKMREWYQRLRGYFNNNELFDICKYPLPRNSTTITKYPDFESDDKQNILDLCKSIAETNLHVIEAMCDQGHLRLIQKNIIPNLKWADGNNFSKSEQDKVFEMLKDQQKKLVLDTKSRYS